MKNSSLISKILMAAVTLGILTYFGVQIYHYANDPMVTTMAYTYQVENTVEISGSMVRQEQVLEGDGGGLMQLRRSEGERVSSGGAVATVYADQASLDRQNEIETLNNRIDQLEYAQESMLGAEVTLKLDSQISKALLDYRSAAAAGRMDTAENHGQELRALVLKRDYLLRHGGSQRTASGAAGSVEKPEIPGGQLRENHPLAPFRPVFRRGGRL